MLNLTPRLALNLLLLSKSIDNFSSNSSPPKSNFASLVNVVDVELYPSFVIN